MAGIFGEDIRTIDEDIAVAIKKDTVKEPESEVKPRSAFEGDQQLQQAN